MLGESTDSHWTTKKRRSIESTVEFGDQVEPTTTIVEAVADATNQSVLDLAPLAESIDPDALNLLLSERADEQSQDLEVTFTYADSIVTVTGTGDVQVTPA